VREDRGADQVSDLRVRPVRLYLLRRQLVGFDPEVLGHREPGAQLLHPAARPRDRQGSHPAKTGLDAGLRREPLVQGGVEAAELGERVCAADLRDQAGGVPRGPAGQPRPLEDDDVRDPQLREVIGDRGAGDAGADHDDPGAVGWLGERLEDRAIELAVREALGSGHGREHGAWSGELVNLLRWRRGSVREILSTCSRQRLETSS
jgi:hypothetical protein